MVHINESLNMRLVLNPDLRISKYCGYEKKFFEKILKRKLSFKAQFIIFGKLRHLFESRAKTQLTSA